MKYKGIKTKIKVTDSKKEYAKYEIRWKNKYHKYKDSLYVVNKDWELCMPNIIDSIKEQIDKVYENIYVEQRYIYRDVIVKLNAIITPKHIIVEAKSKDIFSTYILDNHEELNEKLPFIKKDIKQKIDTELLAEDLSNPDIIPVIFFDELSDYIKE